MQFKISNRSLILKEYWNVTHMYTFDVCFMGSARHHLQLGMTKLLAVLFHKILSNSAPKYSILIQLTSLQVYLKHTTKGFHKQNLFCWFHMFFSSSQMLNSTCWNGSGLTEFKRAIQKCHRGTIDLNCHWRSRNLAVKIYHTICHWSIQTSLIYNFLVSVST